jgi:hypothetical protein
MYPAFVAPFWADVDTNGPQDGTVWRRETNNSTVLNRAREDIQTAFETRIDFQPLYAFVATWDRVNYFRSNTDQVSYYHVCRSICKPLEFSDASHFVYSNCGMANKFLIIMIVAGPGSTQSLTYYGTPQLNAMSVIARM